MTGSPAPIIVAFVIVWALWHLLRLAAGVNAIADELRRLREIAEGRQR